MIQRKKVVDSTQTYIIENINNFNSNDAVYSLKQTHGYGRSGIWESEQENIYFSILIDDINYPSLYTICAIHKFISLFSDSVYIKLPNDLYWDNKKLAGFIIEKYNNKLIIGIGINIFLQQTDSFTSLNSITPISSSIDNLVLKLYDVFIETLSTDIEELNSYFTMNTNIIGKEIHFIDKHTKITKHGVVTNINKDKIVIDNDSYNIYSIKILSK